MVSDFIRHLGHDDALCATAEDALAWAQDLRHGKRQLSAITVNTKYLAAVGSVYRIGQRDPTLRRILKDNPAEGLKVRTEKVRVTRSKGFTEDEAKAVLRAASMASDAETHWLPFLAAYTGARVGELVQLRREDLLSADGVVSIRITPEAGTVKTGMLRHVPLHPQLLAMGFPAFVASRPPGAIFSANGAQQVARMVRKVLGLPPGRGELAPSHGWRHRFKTLAREVGIDLKAADAIQGHADASASGRYGEWSVRALKVQIDKLPVITL